MAIKNSPPPLDSRALRESTTKLEGGLMRSFNRILSVVTLFSLMSVPALRAQDDRQYDPQTDDQQVTQPDQDQSQANQYSQEQSSQDQGSQDRQSAEATSPPQYPQSGDNQPQRDELRLFYTDAGAVPDAVRGHIRQGFGQRRGFCLISVFECQQNQVDAIHINGFLEITEGDVASV